MSETYEDAVRETEGRLSRFLQQFEKSDRQYRAMVENGSRTQSQYEAWRRDQVMDSRRWQEVLRELTLDMEHSAEIAMSIVNGELPDVYAVSHDFGTYEVESGTGISTMYNLYDRDAVLRLIAEDPDLYPQASVNVEAEKRWDRRHITSAVTQGLLQGDTMEDIAKRMRRVCEMSESSAMRAARTCVTSAENSGRVRSYQRAQGMGIKVKKQWLATLDGRTRSSHRTLDGESVDVDDAFSNGLMYPGDPSGPGSQIYNCRCTLVADLSDYPAEQVNRASKLGDMTYEQWRAEHVERTIVPPATVGTFSVDSLEPPSNAFVRSPLLDYVKDRPHGQGARQLDDDAAAELVEAQAMTKEEDEQFTVHRVDGEERGYLWARRSWHINSALREGRLDRLDADDERTVAVMDGVTGRTRLAEDTRFFRVLSEDFLRDGLGISMSDVEGAVGADDLRSMLSGRETVDDGFMSVSYQFNHASFKDRPVIMNMVAKEGTGVIWTENTLDAEAVLARGSKITVVGASKVQYGDRVLLVLDVEVS